MNSTWLSSQPLSVYIKITNLCLTRRCSVVTRDTGLLLVIPAAVSFRGHCGIHSVALAAVFSASCDLLARCCSSSQVFNIFFWSSLSSERSIQVLRCLIQFSRHKTWTVFQMDHKFPDSHIFAIYYRCRVYLKTAEQCFTLRHVVPHDRFRTNISVVFFYREFVVNKFMCVICGRCSRYISVFTNSDRFYVRK